MKLGIAAATGFAMLTAVSRFKIASGAVAVKLPGTNMALMFFRAFVLEDIIAVCRVVLGRVDVVVWGTEKKGLDAIGIGWLFERTLTVAGCDAA